MWMSFALVRTLFGETSSPLFNNADDLSPNKVLTRTKLVYMINFVW